MCRGATADYVPPFFGEKKLEHALVILRVGWGADDDVHGLPPAHLKHKCGDVVIRRVQAKRERRIHEHCRKVLRGKLRRIPTPQAFDHVLARPAVLHHLADAGVRDAIRHQNKQVVFPWIQRAFVDLLFSDEAHGCIVIHIFAVAQQNRARVVILHKAGLRAFHLQHSEGGVGKLALSAHGQRRGDGFNAFIHRQLAGHQGGKDGGSQRGKDVGFHAAAQPIGKNNG